MARAKRNSRLDDAIARTAPGQPPQPDFQAWRMRHTKALALLTQKAQHHSGWRRVPAIPLGKLAIAAGVTIAMALLVLHWVNDQATRSRPDTVAVDQPGSDRSETGEMELTRADELYEAGDVDGLLILLETARYETQIRVVGYLGEIGTPATLPALEQLATQWAAAPGQSTVSQAIEQIRWREQEASGSPGSDSEPSRSLAIVGQGQLQSDSGQRHSQPEGRGSGTVTVETVERRGPSPPLADVLVQAVKPGEDVSLLLGRTDEHGRCTLTVPAGMWQIIAQGWSGGFYRSFAQTVAVQSGQSHEVRIFGWTRQKIMGRLVDDEGRGVEGTVQLDAQAPSDTDPEGWFSIDEPFGGSSDYHVLWGCDHSRRAGQMILFTMRTYGMTGKPLTVPLQRCATIVGRIVDSRGLPLSEAEIQLAVDRPDGTTFCYGPVPWTAQMVGDGTFAIVDIPPGLSVRVNASALGARLEPGQVRVEQPLQPGQTVDVGDVALRDLRRFTNEDLTGTMTGTVMDENGRPLSELIVKAVDFRSTTTDVDGRYELTRLPQGVRLDLVVSPRDAGQSAYGDFVSRYVYANENSDVRIPLHGWDILGKEAPPLSIAKWYDDKPIALDQLRDKVVLLMFSVLGRKGEVDLLLSLSQKYADRGLEIIAIHDPVYVAWADFHIDWDRAVTDEDVQRLAEPEVSGITVCLDDNLRTRSAYGATISPTFYLIDKQGRVRVSTAFRQLRDEWIETLLAE